MKPKSTTILKSHFGFTLLNSMSAVLLVAWIFKNCLNLNTTFTSLCMDFMALVTCIYSLVRVNESIKGNFKILDMVTVYYLSLFFLFSWFLKLLSCCWDYFWTPRSDPFNLTVTAVLFITLLVNFYVTEKINMDNLDKIEADL